MNRTQRKKRAQKRGGYIKHCAWRWLPLRAHQWIHLRWVPMPHRRVLAPPCEMTHADVAWVRKVAAEYMGGIHE